MGTSPTSPFTDVAYPAALLSQTATTQVPAEATTSTTESGAQVVALAQVIIAVGVIPVELIIVAVVIGLHRLTHRKRSSQSKTSIVDNNQPPRRSLLPYLQPKAELEDDERRKRHELHNEHLVHELDPGHEILQLPDDADDDVVLPLQGGHGSVHEMPDDADGLVLPLQGRRGGVYEMPEGEGTGFEMEDQREWFEVLGDECAEELDSEI